MPIGSTETFGSQLAGPCARIWVDNSAGEAILRRGSGRCDDHNNIVHAIWTVAVRLRAGVWIERVCSEENIADEPSRQHYETVNGLGAQWTEPSLKGVLLAPKRWHELYSAKALGVDV